MIMYIVYVLQFEDGSNKHTVHLVCAASPQHSDFRHRDHSQVCSCVSGHSSDKRGYPHKRFLISPQKHIRGHQRAFREGEVLQQFQDFGEKFSSKFWIIL